MVFTLLAALLFALDAAVSDRNAVLTIDRREIDALVAQIESRRVEPLGEAERRRVEEAYVDQRVLAREARALGLEDDPRIDDLLTQKMLHVLSADVIQPTDAELRAYFEENRARYRSPPAVTVEEVVVPDAESAGLQARLVRGENGKAVARAVGGSLRLMRDVTRDDLVRIFGTDTAERVMAAGEGAWVGPHGTVRGSHWIRVVDRSEPGMPELEGLRDQVRRDWIEDQEAVRLERRVAELRGRYSIRFVEGDTEG